MANSRERNLKLVITGETAEVTRKIATLTSDAKGMGVTLSAALKVADAEAKLLTATLTFASKKLENLRKFKSSADVGQGGSKITSQNFESENARIAREEARLQRKKEVRLKEAAAKRLNTAKEVSRELVAIAKEEASLEKAIAFNGANSRVGIKAKAALEEKRIFRKLQTDLQALEAQAKKGVGAGRNDKGQFISRQEAATNLQITAQKKLNKVYSETGAQLDKLPKKLNKVSIEHKSWIRHVTEIVGLYRLVNFSINTVLESAKAVPRIGIELQTTQAVLESTLGSNAAAAGAFKALDKEADRVGQSIAVIRENFRNLNASMSLAGESTNTIFRVFQNLNTVTTALHLSGEKTQNVFLAIAQIFNKTKVQSEELVKQLGNLLPGAFAAFAEAIKKTPQQLAKAMQLGLITATGNVDRFLTSMAEKFKAGFAIAEVGLQANIGRMQSSFIHLGEAIFKAFKVPMTEAVKGLTSLGDLLTAGVKSMKEFSGVVTGVLIFGLTQLGFSLITGIASITTLATAVTAYTTAAGGASVATRLWAGSLAFLSKFATVAGAIAAATFALSKWSKEVSGLAVSEELDSVITEFEKLKEVSKEEISIEVRVDADATIASARESLDRAFEVIKAKKAKIEALKLKGLNKTRLEEEGAALEKLTNKYLKAQGIFILAREGKKAEIGLFDAKQLKREKDLLASIAAQQAASRNAQIQKENRYQNSLKQTSIILQKLGGDKKEAAIAEIKLQTEITKQKFSGNAKGADNARKELDQIQKLKLAQNEIVFGIQAQAEAKAKLSTAEASINASQQAGLLTQIQAFDLIQEKRKEALTAIREMINTTEAQAAAEATLTASQVANFDKARAAIALMYLQMVAGAKRPKTEIELLAKSAKQSLERNLGNAFEGFIRGTASASEAMKNFATSILGEVARIAAQKLAIQLIGLAFKGVSAAFGSGSSFGSGYDSTTGLGNTSVNYGLAKGGITSGLSKVSGTVLTQPTLFPGAKVTPFASGGVLAGEAGAEAVLPLKRNSQGKLGVTAELPAQTKSGGDTYNISVNVTKEKGEDASDTGNKIAIAMMRNIAKGEIANANRPGNQSNKITAFG